MSETNVELARRGWEAASRGDFDVVSGLPDPEVKWHGGDPTAEGTCQNRDQALKWMKRGRELRAVPELVDVHGTGDQVVLLLRSSDDLAGGGGEEGGVTANGSTFRNGKIVEMVRYPDAADAADAADALRATGIDT